jgi:hypothetical protein
MKKIASNRIGIDDGRFTLFSDFDTDGPMWSGVGPREVTQDIAFSDSFLSPPSVHLTIALWDVHEGHNMRMDFFAEDITANGFRAVFKTWGDTKIARLQMAWQAIGEVADPDELWILSD